MLIVLGIVGYIFMMLVTLVIIKCAGWNEGQDDDLFNAAPAIFWPLSLIVGTVYVAYLAVNKLSDIVVAKICPNKAE